jgi:hypothetical protein
MLDIELWSKNQFLAVIFNLAAILKRRQIQLVLKLEGLVHIFKFFLQNLFFDWISVLKSLPPVLRLIFVSSLFNFFVFSSSNYSVHVTLQLSEFTCSLYV